MANAQAEPLGLGNGGQVRCIYYDEPNSQLYIGSDVAGVWRSNTFNVATPLAGTGIQYEYISNL
ncbi:MAG: hypothetical protein IPP29_11005 [Bacteroidetes bacterium]|nr:hypothetical protein [Bacteroidota bacterium]